MKTFIIALAGLSLAACSSTESSNKPLTARKIAVSHAREVASGGESSLGREVGSHLLKRGTSAALGAAKLGWAGDLIDLAGIGKSSRSKKPGVSAAFRHQCLISSVDPVEITARALEMRLGKNNRFTLDSRTPDATIHLTIVDADLKSADAMGLAAQPSFTVQARLVDRKGTVIWKKSATGAGGTHRWSEYGTQPGLFRADLSAAAETIAASLVAELR